MIQPTTNIPAIITADVPSVFTLQSIAEMHPDTVGCTPATATTDAKTAITKVAIRDFTRPCPCAPT
jgi:hypothetical protein